MFSSNLRKWIPSEPTKSSRSRARAGTGLAQESLAFFFWRRWLLVRSSIGQVIACLIGWEIILFGVFRFQIVFIVVAPSQRCHTSDQCQFPQRAPHGFTPANLHSSRLIITVRDRSGLERLRPQKPEPPTTAANAPGVVERICIASLSWKAMGFVRAENADYGCAINAKNAQQYCLWHFYLHVMAFLPSRSLQRFSQVDTHA